MPLSFSKKEGPIEAREGRLFAYLEKIGARTKSHGSKELLQHLQETYTLLKSWGCDEALCHAGLFHSVYGTAVYTEQTIDYTGRENVRTLIGQEAEQLAYLFSVIDRPSGLVKALQTKTFFDRLHKKTIPASEKELMAIVTIEIANILAQRHDKKLLDSIASAAITSRLPFPSRIMYVLREI